MPVSSTRMGRFDGVLFAEGGELAQFYGRMKKAVAGEKLKQFAGLLKAEEQAKFVLALLPAAEPPKVEASTSIRDIEKAREFKEKGNDLFRRNMFLEALDQYTLAIQVGILWLGVRVRHFYSALSSQRGQPRRPKQQGLLHLSCQSVSCHPSREKN